jgi:hypothetical protein
MRHACPTYKLGNANSEEGNSDNCPEVIADVGAKSVAGLKI